MVQTCLLLIWDFEGVWFYWPVQMQKTWGLSSESQPCHGRNLDLANRSYEHKPEGSHGGHAGYGGKNGYTKLTAKENSTLYEQHRGLSIIVNGALFLTLPKKTRYNSETGGKLCLLVTFEVFLLPPLCSGVSKVKIIPNKLWKRIKVSAKILALSS